jgi:hypothetical protein
MSAADTSALSVVDTPAVDAVVDTPAVDTPTTVPDATGDSTVEDTSTETQSTTDSKTETAKAEDSKVDAKEGKAETKADQTADVSMPKATADLLKKLQAANPDNPQIKTIVKELREAFFKNQAYSQAFPSAAEARQVSTIIKELGGVEKFQAYIQDVTASDEKLVSGDPALVSDIVDTLKAEDALGSLDSLTPEFMKAWQEANPKAHAAYFMKTVGTALKNSGLHEKLEGIWKTQLTPSARASVKQIAQWLEGMEQNASSYETERKQQAEVQTKAQEKQISELNIKAAETAEKTSNEVLGKVLGELRVSVPALKALTRDQLQPLGIQIKKDLHAALRDPNSGYQQKLDKLYANGKGLKANFDKIQAAHKETVEALKTKLVRDAIKKVFPNIQLDKPKVVAPAYKTYTQAQIEGWSKNQPLPQADRVPEKPKTLDRSLDPGSRLEILGKGFIPVGGGKYRLVSWRSN